MKWKGLFILTFLWVINANAQYYSDGLNRFVQQELTEQWNGVEWEKSTRSLHGYDPHGRQTSNSYQFFEESSKRWRTLSESVTEYDSRGNTTYRLGRSYDRQTLRLTYEYETKRTYKGDLLIEAVNNERSPKDGSTYQSTWTRTYDEQGRELTSQSITNSDGDIFGNRTNFYWNVGNCLGSTGSEYLYDGVWSKGDSIVYHDCEYGSVTQYRFSGGAPEIVYQSKVVEYQDSSGAAVIEYFSRTSEDEDWSLQTISRQLTDSLNRRIVDSHLYPADSILYTSEYFYFDDQYHNFNLIGTQYSWPDSIPITVMTSINEYDSLERMGSNFSETYNYELDKIVSQSRSNWLTDDQGFLIRHEGFFMHNDYELYYSEVYTNDCDGVVLILESTHSENDQPERKTRSTYTYYQNSDCASVESSISAISVFPNPARDYINVYAPENLGEIKIQIVATDGKIHQEYREEVSNYFHIDTSSLKPGSYTLAITKANISYSKKFLVSY